MEDEQKSQVLARISDLGRPTRSYFLLLFLSTLIATYGLVANSTATVIGAMIVAPLMGPILGLALGLVRGDQPQTARSLVAEIGGVLAVISTACVIAILIGPESIDFGLREITARTQPTLYDLAIGFAAGLAGAYCLVHPRLEASVAGVAIAVALVPPLAVTGLTLAGAHRGQVAWDAVGGSFVLFLANFLTIEFAAVTVFVLAGLGDWRSLAHRSVRAQLLVKVILLALTAFFLSHQLNRLISERTVLARTRQVLSVGLERIPGAWLQDCAVRTVGASLEVVGQVASRQEVAPVQVRQLEDELRKALRRSVNLTLRVVRTEYVAATGLLYEPRPSPDPRQERLQRIEMLVRRALERVPGTSLVDFSSEDVWLDLSIRSPYPVGPELVAKLQQEMRQALGESALRVRVTTTLASVATADRSVHYSEPGPPRDLDLEARLAAADRALRFWALDYGTVEELRLDPPTAAQGLYRVQLRLAGPRPLDEPLVRSWQVRLGRLLETDTSSPAEVSLQVAWRLGREWEASPVPSPKTPTPPGPEL